MLFYNASPCCVQTLWRKRTVMPALVQLLRFEEILDYQVDGIIAASVALSYLYIVSSWRQKKHWLQSFSSGSSIGFLRLWDCKYPLKDTLLIRCSKNDGDAYEKCFPVNDDDFSRWDFRDDDDRNVPVNPSLRLFIKEFERKPPVLYDDILLDFFEFDFQKSSGAERRAELDSLLGSIL